MLIVKIFVNEKQIDEIQIQNTGDKYKGMDKYTIRKPAIWKGWLFHSRKEGWFPLVLQAMEILDGYWQGKTEGGEFKEMENEDLEKEGG
jgi:hypothetical protein